MEGGGYRYLKHTINERLKKKEGRPTVQHQYQVGVGRGVEGWRGKGGVMEGRDTHIIREFLWE